jgi:tetratricopeptide (TPR) repeat protein
MFKHKLRSHSESRRPLSGEESELRKRDSSLASLVQNDRRKNLLITLLLIIATLVAYWQSGDHEFITYDDHEYVTENEVVQAGLTSEGVKWAFTTGHTGNWHPLTWLSIMVDCQLYGLDRTGHYYSNLILHILSTIILFFALKEMTATIWQSAFVAALFALHPLHVESVAWAAERKDVLSGLFWTLTMLAYAFYVERRSVMRYVWVLLAFALGLLAKPMLVTLPLVLLLLDYWPLNRLQRTEEIVTKKAKGHGHHDQKQGKLTPLRLVWEKIPLFALVAASSIITLYIQQRAEASWETLPLPSRVANALVSYVAYIGKMFWPAGLAVFYPHPLSSLPLPEVIGAAVFLAAVSALAIWQWRSRRYIAVGWFWYLGTLVPVIGLVQVGAQSMADRYSYIPLIGLFIIVVWGVKELAEKKQLAGKVVGAFALIVTIALVILTRQQVSYWKNSITLFEHAIAVTPNNYVAHSSIAVGLTRVGRVDDAIAHVTESLRIKPDNAEAHNNLGGMLARQGKFNEAIQHYREAVRIKPDYATARYNLGYYVSQLGNFAEGIEQYREALKIKPDYGDARLNLGHLLAAQGKFAEARTEWHELTRLNPYYDKGWYVLGYYFAAEGKLDSAIQYYTRSVQANPNFPEVRYFLGQALAARGRTQEAIVQYSEALRIRPNYTEARTALDQLRLGRR